MGTMFPGVQIENLGRIAFAEARALQDELVQRRIAGECEDVLLLAEHPPTLTLGRRSREEDLGLGREQWQ